MAAVPIVVSIATWLGLGKQAAELICWVREKWRGKPAETPDPGTTVAPKGAPFDNYKPELTPDGKYRKRPAAPLVALIGFLGLVALASGCASVIQTQENAKWLSGVFASVKCPAPLPPCEPCKPCEPCGPVVTPPGPVEPPPGPVVPPSAGFVVTPGQRVERTIRVPGWVEYRMSGKQPSVEAGATDNCTILWAYRPGEDWQTAGVVVRDYKVKSPQGERRYRIDWRPEKTYLVRLELEQDRARLLVDGAKVAEVDASFDGSATVGYGWPPSQRPGPIGATISGVVWSEP